MLCDLSEGFFKIFNFGPCNHGNHVSMVTGVKIEDFEKSFAYITEYVHTNISANLFEIMINRY